MPTKYSHTYPSTQDIYWAAQLKHFAAQLPAYVNRYQITPAEMTHIQHTASCYTTWLMHRLQQATEALQSNPAAMAPANDSMLDLAPPLFALLRVRVLTRRLQRHPAYTLADGYVLGLPPALHIVHQRGLPQPHLRMIEASPEGAPVLRWQNRRDTTLELEVCRDGLSWNPLTTIQSSYYIDHHPHPAQLARWQYRARYYWTEWSAGQWGRVVHHEVGRGSKICDSEDLTA